MTVDETPSEPLEIPRDLHDAMVAHCVRESPLECCGILGGVPPRVSSIHPLRNELASPTCYRANSQDLIEAVVSLRGRGAEILAIYHSHPRWQAIPSHTDLRENYYGPLPRIIVSLLNETPEVRIWRLEADSYEELSWRIVEPVDPSADA
jgi:[CysO sulfur-carrier protein]-S-L-cysteine hydrolase